MDSTENFSNLLRAHIALGQQNCFLSTEFYIPSEFRQQLQANKENAIKDLVFSPNSYQEYFQKLLWLEEFDLEATYNVNTIVNSVFQEKDFQSLYEGFLSLQLPIKSNVGVGDYVVFVPVLQITSSGASYFKEVITKVENSRVFIKVRDTMASEMLNSSGMHILFYPNRKSRSTSLSAIAECCHNPSYKPLLFPETLSHQSYMLPNLEYERSDEMQKQAIEHIVAKSSRPFPYILFGPPGTGKTSTITEVVRQVLKFRPGSRILICAPSNYSANVIARKLLNCVPKERLLRYFSVARQELDEIPEDLKCISNVISKRIGRKVIEKMSELDSFVINSKKVVVSTLLKASRFNAMNLSKFSYVFIDEAGMATEPQTLVGFTKNIDEQGLLVLAGDHKQLRPVVTSALIQTYGQKKPSLDLSMLERLMTLPLYGGENECNPQYVTMLRTNRRSHQAISKVSSLLFYSNLIQTSVRPDVSGKFIGCELLPNPNFPLIFEEAFGCEQTKPGSYTYYNIKEAYLVADWVTKLIRYTDDIGVITPYAGQEFEIKMRLQQLLGSETARVKVGSVEKFQSDERSVVIVSTVRASDETLTECEQYKLGFIRDANRFNVTITRAMSLLIVIGCPRTLMANKNWAALIEYIKEGRGYLRSEESSKMSSAEVAMEQLSLGSGSN